MNGKIELTNDNETFYSSVNVIVRRLGGGYGSKISRAAQIACCAALVTHLLGRTCRFTMPLQTNMQSVGKRIPTNCNFEVYFYMITILL